MVDTHDEALKTAEQLNGLVATKFRDEKLYEGFCNAIIQADPVEQLVDLEAML
jgi:hypothetical protein